MHVHNNDGEKGGEQRGTIWAKISKMIKKYRAVKKDQEVKPKSGGCCH